MAWMVRDQIEDGDHSGNSFRQAQEFQRVGFKLFEILYPESSCKRPILRHHYRSITPVYIFSKGRPRTVKILRDIPVRYHDLRRVMGFAERDGTPVRARPMDTQELGFRGNGGRDWYYQAGGNRTATETYLGDHKARFLEMMRPR